MPKLRRLRRSAEALPFCALLLLAARAASAQQPPAAEEDDLELPAAPAAPAKPAAPPPAPPPDPNAPAAGEQPAEDDLELPAAPAPPAPGTPAAAPAPSAAAPVPASPVGPATPTASPAAAAPASATASPASSAAAPASPEAAVAPAPASDAAAASAARPLLPTGNLELTAHSRPVPRGLLFSGFAQAEFVHSQLSEDQLEQSGAPFNRDEFALRSARLRLDGGHEYTAYTLELDATTRGGPSIGIRRAEGSLLYRGDSPREPGAPLNRPPLLALTAGITDLPFGFELVESSRTRAFMERSAGSEAIFPTQMDTGIKLHGAWEFLRYAVAVVNGEPVAPGAPPRDSNAHKDIVGRFGAEAAIGDSVAISGGTSFAFGKGFHPGSVAVKDSVAWRDDNNDGVAIPSEIVGVPGSAATPSESFERWAIGLDLQFSVRSPIGATRFVAEAFVAQNHDRGRYRSDPVQTGFDLRQVGGYLGLTQELSPYALVAVRVDAYDPDSDFFEERRGELIRRSQGSFTVSPIIGFVLPERARLLFQYDFIDDELGRDAVGNPTDAENNQFTARLQVDL